MKEILPVNGSFQLMELPYPELGQAVSAATLSYHHGRHLRTYVDNLNKALPDSGFAGRSLQEIVRHADGALFNNAGQVLNHTLYFEQFSPAATRLSEVSDIYNLLLRDFGSVEAFCKEFEQKGASLFGSGWVWLSADDSGKLVITQHANADNPVCHNLKPLLTFDVWEHAYYLDYQNRRADYLAALWPFVDWQVVAGRL